MSLFLHPASKVFALESTRYLHSILFAGLAQELVGDVRDTHPSQKGSGRCTLTYCPPVATELQRLTLVIAATF